MKVLDGIDMKPKRTTKFSALDLDAALLSSIEKSGYARPTDIQQAVIPVVLSGKDVLASAETGSGKTAAFVLPVLQKIIEQRAADGWVRATRGHVHALVLAPTRELVVQIREEVNKLAGDVSPEIRCLSVYGGIRLHGQMKAVRSGVDILISTPNRLLELAEVVSFSRLHAIVLDEADRLVSEQFRSEIDRVLKQSPKRCQRLLFTATFPERIRELVRLVLRKPVIIKHDHQTERVIDQHVVTVNHDKKHALLAHLLNQNDWQQILVFCSAKKTCDRVAEKLHEEGIEAMSLHGNKPQKERLQTLERFKSNQLRVLIATDIASRGIDIASLDCVINFELPRLPNDYIHRIGRTGRAGQPGQAISLIAHHEYAHFGVIEKRNGLQLEREQIEGFEADSKAPPPTRSRSRKKAEKTGKKRNKKKGSQNRKKTSRKNRRETDAY